eukprot:TCONS_00064842-protein
MASLGQLICLTTITLLVFIKLAESSGTMEIKLLSYANPEHRMSNGRCCEEGLEKDCKRNDKNRCIECTMECDPQFKFEMRRNNERVMFYNTSTLEHKDNFDFKDVLEPNIHNPFMLNLSSFKGNFTFSIKSFDHDDQGIDPIDESIFQFNTKSLDTKIQPNNETVYLCSSGKVTKTNFTIRYTCDADFYGPACDRFCLAQNDVKGHYTCDRASGEMICLDGWTDAKTNCTTITPSSMIIAPSTSTPTLMMSSTVNTDASSSMMVYGSIRPTRSAIQMMTSSVVCNSTITKVNLDLKLQGELKLNEFNDTMQHIICIEVNKACYNLIGQCTKTSSRDQLNLKDIEILEERFVNQTLSDFKLRISSATGKCNENFAKCARESIYNSKQLRHQLGAEKVEICTNSKGCEQRATLLNNDRNKKEEGKDEVIIIAVLCTMFGVVVLALGLLYLRKKRMMKIGNLEDQKSSNNNNDDEKTNIVDDKETSSC